MAATASRPTRKAAESASDAAAPLSPDTKKPFPCTQGKGFFFGLIACGSGPLAITTSGAQRAARGLFDIADDLLRQRVGIFVGQRLVGRLDQNFDRRLFLALADGCTLEETEDGDTRDQFAVRACRRPDDRARFDHRLGAGRLEVRLLG